MKKKLTNRQVSICIIFSLLFLIVFLSFVSVRFDPGLSGKNLSVIRHENMPLREISGAYLFYNKELDKNYVYTVGDASSEISISEIDLTSKKLSNSYSIDIKKKIIEKFAVCTSRNIKPCKRVVDALTKQWESLYVDPLKRIFLLNEALATIVIYDQKQDKITHTINLSRFTLEKPAKQQNSMNQYIDENSLGEGFLPLNNGHIIVAKENNPPILLEFGPSQDKPQGFSPHLLVDENHGFDLPQEKNKLVPLYVWKLPPELKFCDLSELRYSNATGLNLLSQKCQIIMELSDMKVGEEIVALNDKWHLPRTLKYAEAFIALPERGSFLVFEDKKSVIDNNFYFLSGVPSRKKTL